MKRTPKSRPAAIAAAALAAALLAPRPARAERRRRRPRLRRRRDREGGEEGQPRRPRAAGDRRLDDAAGAARTSPREGYQVNAHGCRQIDEGLDVIRDAKRQGPPAAPGRDRARRRRQRSPPGQIGRAFHLLGPRRVLGLVTPRELGGGTGSDADAVRAAAKHHPRRVVLLDWVAYSARPPRLVPARRPPPHLRRRRRLRPPAAPGPALRRAPAPSRAARRRGGRGSAKPSPWAERVLPGGLMGSREGSGPARIPVAFIGSPDSRTG